LNHGTTFTAHAPSPSSGGGEDSGGKCFLGTASNPAKDGSQVLIAQLKLILKRELVRFGPHFFNKMRGFSISCVRGLLFGRYR